jgi:mannosyl-3-phosphoglycerate synthase
MNEEFKTIESVLSGIPHDCLIILVSNSTRHSVDRYQTEINILKNFCRDADRSAIAIHQKDLGAAKAFHAAGAVDLVADDGLIHHGKGEGMLIGMALTALTGREYIGFVDADNYIPGAMLEYCKSYAAGLHLASAPDAMVRVAWASKPKERDGRLMFDRKGRSSRVVNEWLNDLLQHFSGFGTDCIITGNAGEHAMTMSLGMKLELASGFAVEPNEYIYMLENLSGQLPQRQSEREGGAGPPSEISQVHVHQIETRNPHLHDNKGEDHVSGMRAQALNMLYHANITPESMKKALQKWMQKEGVLEQGEVPPMERIYPSIDTLDLNRLYDVLNAESESIERLTSQPDIQGNDLLGRFSLKEEIEDLISH